MSPPTNRPIGFWLRRADEAITSSVNAALAELGLDRSRWQLLNVVAERPGSTAEVLATELQGVVDALRLARLIAVMRDEGFIAADRLVLTDAGVELHEKALGVQTAVRQRAVNGVSPEEYNATLSVLERIVSNLESSLS